MVYESVKEIFESLDEASRRFRERVEGLSEAEENLRPPSGAWSVAEIVEHVSIVEHQLFQLTSMMLMKAEASGAKARPDKRIPPASLDQFAEHGKAKLEAPESARPRGGVRVADSLAKMSDTRASLHSLRPRLEEADLSVVQYPHPYFGPLDLYQWLILIGAHEARHLNQIESLIRSSEGKAN